MTALQILGLLDGFDVSSWGDGTTDYYHYMTEATKVAFADRDAWTTGPDTTDILVEELLAPDYLRGRRQLIGATRTLPFDCAPDNEPLTHESTARRPGGDTLLLQCRRRVGDGRVRAIQPIYYDFGSGVIAGETGIVLQNRGLYFSLGATGVNRLEPGKRPFHTLVSALLTKDGEPWLLYGTMGGEGQPQTQAALVSRIVDFGYDVQHAIDAPRWLFGRTWGSESRSLSLEKRIADDVVTDLTDLGHTVSLCRTYDETMGHAQAIRIHENGTLSGGADPRGDGAALGY